MLTQTYIEKLQREELLELAEFVVTENYNHHLMSSEPEGYFGEIQAIYKEESIFFDNSEVFTTKDYTGSILGTIRVLKWNFIDQLPIQKIFGIYPLLAINKEHVRDVFHVGRFAVKKESCDVNLFKRLLICVAELICKQKDNVAFAECDSKLLRMLNLLGVKTTILGESIDYLGSETIPIAMTYDGIVGFYNKNKHLVHDYLNNTPKIPYKTRENNLEQISA